MALPFLFTMGLCALSHALKVQALQMTDLLPIEEKVEIGHLSNGVKTYIQEYSLPDQCGSFRVVLKKGASEEELFLYDGPIHSMDSIEQFFNDCKEKILVDSRSVTSFRRCALCKLRSPCDKKNFSSRNRCCSCRTLFRKGNAKFGRKVFWWVGVKTIKRLFPKMLFKSGLIPKYLKLH